MNLQSFVGKKVRLVDTNGNVLTGTADIYHHDYDTASGSAALTFIADSGDYLDFDESEIKSIELAYASTQELAVAV